MTFAELEAEYRAALKSARRANRRLTEAAGNLGRAQCGQEFGVARPRRHRCTLEAGHPGEHSNAFTRTNDGT